MKKYIILLILLGFAIENSATIRRCNNNPGSNAPFNDMNLALSASSNGDTIYLEPSPINYSNIFINKRIVIIGNGSNYDNNLSLNIDTMTSKLNIVIFNSQLGKGSKIYSCEINQLNIQNVDSVSIIRNHMKSVNIHNCHQLAFYQNYFNPNLNAPTATTVSLFIDSCKQLVFANNLIRTIPTSLTTSDSIYFSNNTFHNASFLSTIFSKCFLYNNVFKEGDYDIDATSYEVFDNVFSDQNTLSLVNVPLSNGNLVNVPVADIFLNTTGNSVSSQFINPTFLKQNIGMYTGVSPFKIGCIAPIPSIFQLNIPTLSTSKQVPISISIRSNQ